MTADEGWEAALEAFRAYEPEEARVRRMRAVEALRAACGGNMAELERRLREDAEDVAVQRQQLYAIIEAGRRIEASRGL